MIDGQGGSVHLMPLCAVYAGVHHGASRSNAHTLSACRTTLDGDRDWSP